MFRTRSWLPILVTSVLGSGFLGTTAVAAQPMTEADIRELEVSANEGSFDAMLQLGLAYDLGIVVKSDRSQALDWYLQAARSGDPDGQFNAAVMMDAGLVPGADDPQAVFHWYTRAATNGQARAQYNLGLIYAQGDGVETNTALARYWFTKAADHLPAATDKLASLPSDGLDKELSVPVQPIGALVTIDAELFAEMTWIAPPGPKGSYFEVEILAWSEEFATWSPPISENRTNGNGVVTWLDTNSDQFAWRVAMVEEDSVNARQTAWMRMGPGEQALPIDKPFLPINGRTDPSYSETIREQIKATMNNSSSN